MMIEFIRADDEQYRYYPLVYTPDTITLFLLLFIKGLSSSVKPLGL